MQFEFKEQNQEKIRRKNEKKSTLCIKHSPSHAAVDFVSILKKKKPKKTSE